MTVTELINKLEKLDKDKVVVVYDGYGWANIEKLQDDGSKIRIYEEINALFQS